MIRFSPAFSLAWRGQRRKTRRTGALACPVCVGRYRDNDPTTDQSGLSEHRGQARVPVLQSAGISHAKTIRCDRPPTNSIRPMECLPPCPTRMATPGPQSNPIKSTSSRISFAAFLYFSKKGRAAGCCAPETIIRPVHRHRTPVLRKSQRDGTTQPTVVSGGNGIEDQQTRRGDTRSSDTRISTKLRVRCYLPGCFVVGSMTPF